MTSNQIKVLVGLVVVIWAVTLLVQGHPVPLDYVKAFSYAVTGVSLALVLWNRWLWSWKIFRPWLTKRPDLRGTWMGHLVSSWVDPQTQQGRGEIESYLVIRQTYLPPSVCPPISSLIAREFTHSRLCIEIPPERCFAGVAR
jgi:hypothetical protein